MKTFADLLPAIIIIIIIVITLTVWLMIIYFKNPKASSIESNNGRRSKVTHSLIGRRGNMGNQLFQIATVLSAAERSGAIGVFPTSLKDQEIFSLFTIDNLNYENLPIDRSFREFSNEEQIIVPDDGRNYDIRGYRQSHRYFSDNQTKIREQLRIRDQVLNQVKKHLPERFISVHVRRGDTLNWTNDVPLFRGLIPCGIDYYREGIKKLREYMNLQAIIVTDDRDWVSNNIHLLGDRCSLSPMIEGLSPKFSDFCTIYLGEGRVISNSTYSWWADWLGNQDTISVFPSPWWHNDGFFTKVFNLNGDYLYGQKRKLITLHPQRGTVESVERNNDESTLSLYKLIRGLSL